MRITPILSVRLTWRLLIKDGCKWFETLILQRHIFCWKNLWNWKENYLLTTCYANDTFNNLAVSFAGKDWDKIIPKADIDKAEEEEQQRKLLQLNLPPRVRTTIQQLERNYDSDAKKGGEEDEESSSSDSDEDKPKRRGRPRAGKQDNVKGFTNAEIRRFIKSFKKFGSPLTR